MPIVQYRHRDGLIDLGWGHPHPGALPVEAWAQASADAVRAHGWAALTYGYATGPEPLIEWLCDRLADIDGRRPEPAEVFLTAGASHALELLCTLLVRPGDAVLVDAPTYHLALRTIADHTGHIVPAPADPDRLEELIGRLRSDGHRVPLLYLVATFGNPTGASVPVQRRTALAGLAARTGVLIVEDDTYRELAYDGVPPPSIFSAAAPGTVARIGSFSKTVAPGLRLGWITAGAGLVATLADRGYVDSGGGVNHTNAVTMAHFGTSGEYGRHLAQVRSRYRAQRDRLVSAVREHLPAAEFAVPAGGWFLWLRLPPGPGAGALLPAAEAAGVSYLEGRRFFVDGTGDAFLRLSFSLLEGDLLAEGARRLGAALG
jgi:DNA-binding transcriptional MocR family regulator